MTAESVQRAKEFQDAMNQTRVVVGSLTDGFYQAVIPALTVFVEWIGKAAAWMVARVSASGGSAESLATSRASSLHAPSNWRRFSSRALKDVMRSDDSSDVMA